MHTHQPLKPQGNTHKKGSDLTPHPPPPSRTWQQNISITRAKTWRDLVCRESWCSFCLFFFVSCFQKPWVRRFRIQEVPTTEVQESEYMSKAKAHEYTTHSCCIVGLSVLWVFCGVVKWFPLGLCESSVISHHHQTDQNLDLVSRPC